MAPGLTHPGGRRVRKKGPHQACGLYAHVTWHTWRRVPAIRKLDVSVITDSVLEAGRRTLLRVFSPTRFSDTGHLVAPHSLGGRTDGWTCVPPPPDTKGGHPNSPQPHM